MSISIHAIQANRPVTLLNAAILTDCGTFRMRQVSLAYARKLVKDQEFASAIGHATTAKFVSSLFGIHCPMNRCEYRQRVGDIALVLRLHARLPEGKTLDSLAEIERIGYSLSTIERVA